MTGGMIQIAGSRMNRPSHVCHIQLCHDLIQTSFQRHRVLTKLKKICFRPVLQLFSAGNKSADLFPVRKTIEHPSVDPQICRKKRIQDQNYINITLFCGFPSGITALYPDKPDAVSKCTYHFMHIFFQPIVNLKTHI